MMSKDSYNLLHQVQNNIIHDLMQTGRKPNNITDDLSMSVIFRSN